MSSRLVLCETDRGVPQLSRGWRTPDPSPTRDAAGLPRCGPANYGIQAEEPDETPSQSPRGRPKIGASPSNTSTTAPSTRAASRTPSPWKSCGGPSMTDKALGDTPTSGLWCWGAGPVGAEQGASTPRGAVMYGAEAHAPMNSAPPPALSGPPPLAFRLTAPMAPMVPPPPTPNAKGGEVCISYGSIGHPYTCADFCKYAKKDRGCKDGAACDHCHLCSGKKVKPGGSRVYRRQRRG
mmetsp:Transcript_61066/g.120228  ORF Transcript_61066/g.120228 Transcript_61066/m.120228 type:complete len:237 (+) Transcript_61066:57-767(+)